MLELVDQSITCLTKPEVYKEYSANVVNSNGLSAVFYNSR